jgi:hypothetical protein
VGSDVAEMTPPKEDTGFFLSAAKAIDTSLSESDHMLAFSDGFPLAIAGLTFTILGSLKLWGLNRGIEGGADKPAVERLCGT